MQPLWLISLYGTDPLGAKVLLGNLTLSYFFFFSFYHISIVQIFLYIRISWASFLKMLMSGHIPRPIKSQSQPMDRGLSLFFFLNSAAKFEDQCFDPFIPLLRDDCFTHTVFAIPPTCQAQLCYMILSSGMLFPQEFAWLAFLFLQVSAANVCYSSI